jgi:hypothetical protein
MLPSGSLVHSVVNISAFRTQAYVLKWAGKGVNYEKIVYTVRFVYYQLKTSNRAIFSGLTPVTCPHPMPMPYKFPLTSISFVSFIYKCLTTNASPKLIFKSNVFFAILISEQTTPYELLITLLYFLTATLRNLFLLANFNKMIHKQVNNDKLGATVVRNPMMRQEKSHHRPESRLVAELIILTLKTKPSIQEFSLLNLRLTQLWTTQLLSLRVRFLWCRRASLLFICNH